MRRASHRGLPRNTRAPAVAVCLVILLAGCNEILGFGGFTVGGADASPSLDAGRDAGRDGGRDSGTDAGPTAADAGALVPTEAPLLRWPANGAYTGNPHTPLDAPIAEHPLRPRLLFAPVDDATDYQVQLDDCGTVPHRECEFDSPEVDVRTPGEAAPRGEALRFRPIDALPISLGAPVGRRYVWRVRACAEDGCGPWSTSRYLQVGREPNDLNGDGYPDVAVGAPNVNSYEGRAYVYLGNAGVLPTTPTRSLVGPDGVDGEFGRGISIAGDLDGDGFADLVVGAPGAARAYVYRGSTAGVPIAPDVMLGSAHPTSELGWQVSRVGDVDGDGFDDVGVAAPGTNSGEGRAYVYLGGVDGPSTTAGTTLIGPDGIGGDFGEIGGAGDVDGDGYPDILVGAESVSSGEGRAYLYLGGMEGVAVAPAVTLIGPAGTFSQFGSAVAGAGDVDGDGYAEIAVGARAASDEGRVYVYAGRAGAPATTPTLTLAGATGEMTALGASLAGARDLDGDGFDDLVVGASFTNLSQGAVHAYLGGPTGLASIPAASFSGWTGAGYANFGDAVSVVGDTNGDGYADVFAGAPVVNAAEGRAYLYRGTADGVSEVSARTLVGPGGSGGVFGVSVARGPLIRLPTARAG